MGFLWSIVCVLWDSGGTTQVGVAPLREEVRAGSCLLCWTDYNLIATDGKAGKVITWSAWLEWQSLTP